MRAVGPGRGLFAVASASLAVWSLCYRQLAWQALPTWIPAPVIWIEGTAVVLLAASAGLCIERTALPSVMTIGAYLLLAIALAVPQIVSQPLGIGAWYPLFEALTALAGAWILYASLRRQSRASDTPIACDGAVRSAQVSFGIACVFYGWSHFVYAGYTASMVPAWLPAHVPLAYFTGLCHMLAGIAIIVGILPALAAKLEAIMMSLFGLLVWVPSFFAHPRPPWAMPPQSQWSELVVNLLLAAAAWLVAGSIARHAKLKVDALEVIDPVR